jgi:hypothetical protein
MEMFIVCLRHDKGKVKIAINARDTERAIRSVMRSEKAPKSAVLWVRKGK